MDIPDRYKIVKDENDHLDRTVEENRSDIDFCIAVLLENLEQRTEDVLNRITKSLNMIDRNLENTPEEDITKAKKIIANGINDFESAIQNLNTSCHKATYLVLTGTSVEEDMRETKEVPEDKPEDNSISMAETALYLQFALKRHDVDYNTILYPVDITDANELSVHVDGEHHTIVTCPSDEVYEQIDDEIRIKAEGNCDKALAVIDTDICELEGICMKISNKVNHNIIYDFIDKIYDKLEEIQSMKEGI